RQHFIVEAVAADAEILVGAPLRSDRARLEGEARLVPAPGLPHALGPPGVDRLVHGIAAQRVEDVDQVLLQQVADRQPRLDAARVDVSVGLDRDLRSVEAVLQESEPAGPAVAEVVRERRRAEPVLPGAPARPQLADPAAGLGAEEMIDGPRPLE